MLAGRGNRSIFDGAREGERPHEFREMGMRSLRERLNRNRPLSNGALANFTNQRKQLINLRC